MGNNEQCFHCKRTENEVRELLKSNLKPNVQKHNSEIIQITATLKKIENDLKSHVDAVLKIFENVQKEHLEFSLRDTLFDNRDIFKKVIPNIDELDEIVSYYGHHSSQYWSGIDYATPFFTARDFFMNVRKHMDDKNSKEHLEDLENFQGMVLGSFEQDLSIFGLNTKLFERNDLSENLEQTKIKEEYRKMGHSITTLKKLIEERKSNVTTSDPQLKAIQELRHSKIFRNVFSSDGFFPKIGTSAYASSESYGYGDKRPENIIETPFSIAVCAICYSFVWYTTNVTLKEISSPDQNSALIN